MRPSSCHPPSTRRRRGAHRGEVGAGVGLGEQLAPQLLGGGDGRQPARLLLVGPVGEERRPRQVHADASHELGAPGRGPAPPARRSSRRARGRVRRTRRATSSPPSPRRPGPPASAGRRPPLRRGRRSAAADLPRTPMAGGSRSHSRSCARRRSCSGVVVRSIAPASMTHASGSGTGSVGRLRPVDFDLSVDQVALRDAAADLLDDVCSTARVREVADHRSPPRRRPVGGHGRTGVAGGRVPAPDGGRGLGLGWSRWPCCASSWDATWLRCPSPAPWSPAGRSPPPSKTASRRRWVHGPRGLRCRGMGATAVIGRRRRGGGMVAPARRGASPPGRRWSVAADGSVRPGGRAVPKPTWWSCSPRPTAHLAVFALVTADGSRIPAEPAMDRTRSLGWLELERPPARPARGGHGGRCHPRPGRGGGVRRDARSRPTSCWR